MASRPLLNHNFKTKFYKEIMPKIYGIGAAVVIVGAMFKLLNWPGSGLMLGIGLATEALIFFFSAFEPPEEEIDWTKVYPELLGVYEGKAALARAGSSSPVGAKLDDMFAQAQIDSALIERLGQGMHSLASTVANLASVPDLSEATNKYMANVGKASEVLEGMYEIHKDILGAMHRLASVSQDIPAYHAQVQSITETLSVLETAYKKELQEAGVRSETTQKVYMHIAESMEKLQTASEATAIFETELTQLSGKIASLNGIYGNMLTALKQ